MGMNDADLRFRASLEDDVSPKVDQLEKKLRKMGATPSEIRMFIKAYDEATPKLKMAQEHIKKLPKTHTIRMNVDDTEATRKLNGIKDAAKHPIKVQLQVIDNIQDTMNRMFNLRSRVPSGMPGGNMLYGLGPGGAAATGVVGGAAAGLYSAVQTNAKMEQSLVTLTQTLKDQQRAKGEMGKLVDFANKTPFQYEDVLAADVRLRSYQIPTQKGEGGPGNQGWLKSAGDMAAALNTPITQAVEAIADARQGYFVRMMSYGIRMMREDFEAGGKYGGLTYDQGLEKALKRFQGSMDMQSKTFVGVMSNLKDIFQNNIMKPVGNVPFQMIRQGANDLQDKFQDPDFQRKLGKDVEKVQANFVQLFAKVQEGKQYFESNLLQPLKTLGIQLGGIGKQFAQTFGNTLQAALKTVATVLFGVTKPLVQLIDTNPGLVRLVATFKALQIVGIDFMKPFKTMMSINPLNWVKGFQQLSTTMAALKIALLVKGMAEAKTASDNLNRSFKDLADDSMQKFENRLGLLAGRLGTTGAKLKELATLSNDTMGVMGSGDPELRKERAEKMAVFSVALERQYGKKTGTASEYAYLQAEQAKAYERQGYSTGQSASMAPDAIEDLASAAQKASAKISELSNFMATLGENAQKFGLANNPAAAAPFFYMQKGLSNIPMTEQQLGQGITNPTMLIDRLLGEYRQPSVETLRKVGGRHMNNLSNFWDLRDIKPGTSGPGTGGGISQQLSQALGIVADEKDTLGANKRGERDLNGFIQKYAPGFKLPATPHPLYLPDTKALQTAVGKGDQAGAFEEAARTASKLRTELDQINEELATANDKLNKLNAHMQGLTLVQDRVANAMNDWIRKSILPLQRAIEDSGIALQEYTYKKMRPLEDAMTRMNEKGLTLSHTMQSAQYDMSKWTSGLLEGEQAALNQVHAMERYNRQLQMMQLQYQQIGAEIGQTTYDQGASVRVRPLSQITLAMQSQKAQRKLQLAQMKYDDSFGEQHYQLEQASRLENDRTERPFADRLKGIKDTVPIIDAATRAQRQMGEEQYQLQVKTNAANKEMRDQQRHLEDMQLNLSKLNASPEMRNFQDAQAHLQRKMASLNIAMSKQNIEVNKLTEQSEPLKDMTDAYNKLIQGLIDTDKIDPVKLAGKLRLIGKAMGQDLFGFSPEQTKAVTNSQKDLVDALNRRTAHEIDTDGSFWLRFKTMFKGIGTGETWQSGKELIQDKFGANDKTAWFLAIVSGVVAIVGTYILSARVINLLFKQAAGLALHTILNDKVRPIATTNRLLSLGGAKLRESDFAGEHGARLEDRNWRQRTLFQMGARLEDLGDRGIARVGERQLRGDGLPKEFVNTAFRWSRNTRMAGAEGLLGMAGKLPFGLGIPARLWYNFMGGEERVANTSLREMAGFGRQSFRGARRRVRSGQASIEEFMRNVAKSDVPEEMQPHWDSARQARTTAGEDLGAAKEARDAAKQQVNAAQRQLNAAVKNEKLGLDIDFREKGRAKDALKSAEKQLDAARQQVVASTKTAIIADNEVRRQSRYIGMVNQNSRIVERFDGSVMSYEKFSSRDRSLWRVFGINFRKAGGELVDRMGDQNDRLGIRLGTRIKHFGDEVTRFGVERSRIGRAAAAMGRVARRHGRVAATMVTVAATFTSAITIFKDAAKSMSSGIAAWLRKVAPGAAVDLQAAERARTATAARRSYEELSPDKKKEMVEKGETFLSKHPALYKALSAAGKASDVGMLGMIGYGAAKGQGEDLALLGLGGAGLVRTTIKAGGLKGLAKLLEGKSKGELVKLLGTRVLSKLAGPVGVALMGKDIWDVASAVTGGPLSDKDARTNQEKKDYENWQGFQDQVKGKKIGHREADVLGDIRNSMALTDNMIKEAKKRHKDTTALEKARLDLMTEYDAKFEEYSAHSGDQLTKEQAKDLKKRIQQDIPFYADSMTMLKKHWKDRKTEDEKGFQGIWKTADHYLDVITRRYNRANNSLGLVTDNTQRDFNASDNYGAVGRGADTTGAANGLLDQHMIKGKGDSKGYLIRVGEESDEAIVPLAAHRRDRAKSLVKQLQGRLGMHGQDCEHCTGAFANGGFAVDRAYLTAKAAYGRARGTFANGGFTKGTGHFTGPFGSLEGMNVLAAFAKKNFGLTTTAGRSNHDLHTASGNISDHSWGGAIDVSNGVLTPQEDAFAVWAKRRLGGTIKQLIWRNKIQAGSGLGATVTGHENHVHIAMLQRFANSDELMAELLGGDISKRELRSLIASSGGSGSLPPLNLPRVPRKLTAMGAVGSMIAKALHKMRRKVLAGAGTGSLEGFTGGGTASENVALGKKMAAVLGWTGKQFQALNQLWTGESGWRTTISNYDGSGAYGIPQALPGNKMASAGKDWRTNPATQIKWGLQYIKDKYGSPIGALNKWMSRSPHWYAAGKRKIENESEFAVLHKGERVLNPAEAASANDDTGRRNIEKANDAKVTSLRRITMAVEGIKENTKSKGKDLSAFNAEVRKTWIGNNAAQTALGKKYNAGTGSGDNEGPLALLTKEIKDFKVSAKAFDKTKAGKAATKLVKKTTNLQKSAKSLLKTAETPRQKRLAKKAVVATKKAVTSAKKARSMGRSSKYLQRAAKRGTNLKIAQKAAGRKLTAKERKAYTKAAKDPSAKNLTALRKTLASELKKVRAGAKKDASKASKAVRAAAKSQGKDIDGMGKLVSKHVKDSGKNNSKSAKKADDNNDRRDAKNDKRDKDYQKKSLKLLGQIVEKSVSVNVHNVATGATLNSKVSTNGKKRK